MNTLYIILVLFSGVSFIIYGCLFFLSPQMRNEFKRFGLEKFATLTGTLELLGGVGMLVGLKFNFILIISSGGLALLMLLGFGVRLKIKDGFWLSMPSLFFMLLNLYLFLITI
ncbi:MAG TPA: DoxX family protein [Ignavibacteriaceae bacterium]|nr:DoxX family protein [Ignavibacteriaceae bacterium]